MFFALLGLLSYFLTFNIKRAEVRKPIKVKLRLLWEAQAGYAGYYIAKELGYYEDEGLQVEIIPSLGAGDIIPVIADHPYQFGVTQLSNLIRAIDKGIPVKGIAQIVQESNLLLVTHKTSNILSVKDFKGKILSTWWGKDDFMIRMLLEKEGLKQNDIHILDEKYWSNKSFLEHTSDIITAMRYNEYNQLVMRENVPEDELRVFAYKDYDLNFPEDVLFTSELMLNNYPLICDKFRMATIKGWEYAINNKDASTRIVVEKYASGGNANYKEQLRQLQLVSESILAGNENVNIIGVINIENIKKELDALINYNIINNKLMISDVFDNRFVRKDL